MAYAVEKGPRRFVGTGGVVTVHVALAYLLVFGLAAPIIDPPEDQPFVGEPIPLPDPPKPDDPEPKPKQDPKTQTEDPIPVPQDPWPFPREDPRPKAPEDPFPPRDPFPTPTGGGSGSGTIEPPLFTPTLAKPINNVLRWVTDRDYPRSAIRAEEQGITRFSLKIDARGNVTDCSIIRSSGSEALDAATCAKVTSRAKFEPATDKYGAKVSGTYSNSVNWKLPE